MSKVGKPYKKTVELRKGIPSDVNDETLVTVADPATTEDFNLNREDFQTGFRDPLIASLAVTGIIDPENTLIFTINSSDASKFDYTGGLIQFADAYTDPANPTITVVDIPPAIGVSATNIGSTSASFLYFDIDGNLTQDTLLRGNEFIRDHVVVTIFTHPASVITNSSNFTSVAVPNTAMSLSDLSFTVGNMSGVVGGQNKISGSSGLTKLDKKDGDFYYHAINVRTAGKSPNVIVSPEIIEQDLLVAWSTTDVEGGKFVFRAAGIEAGVFDDKTAVFADTKPNGVVAAADWVNNRVLFIVDSAQLTVQYGTTTYPTAVAAKLGLASEDFAVIPVLIRTVPIATVTMRGGATDLSNINDAEIRQAISAMATFQ